LDTVFASEHDESEAHHHTLGPPQDLHISPLPNHPPNRWQNLIVVRVGETTFERGDWDVLDDHRIIGIRRKSRSSLSSICSAGGSSSGSTTTPTIRRSESLQGLAQSALERWELWSFNPSDLTLQASCLASLQPHPLQTPSPTPPIDLQPRSADGAPSERSFSQASSRSSFISATTSNGSSTQKRPNGVSNQSKNGGSVPRLHFTRVAPFIGHRSICVAGFGNTVGLFDLNTGEASPFIKKRPSLERTLDVSNHYL